jgi:tetratricopeptide (TPR) repeat protein
MGYYRSHSNLKRVFRTVRAREQWDFHSSISGRIAHESIQQVSHPEVNRSRLLADISSLIKSFRLSRRMEVIDEAIMKEHEVIRLTPLNSRWLPLCVSELGTLHRLRFEEFGEFDDIENALQQQLEAVRLTAPDSPDLQTYLNNLGISFMYRFDCFGEVKDIDSAIKHQLDAVRLVPLDYSGLPPFLSNLGVSFMRRYERFGERKDVDNAIEKQLEAVRLTPLDGPNLPTYLNNVGLSLRLRFERFGEVKDIDNAIEKQLEAVRLTPLDGPDVPLYLTNLGTSFMRRFDLFGELKDINSALQKEYKAVKLTPLGHRNLPTYLNNLGQSFRHRFEIFGEMMDIDYAVKYFGEAVQAAPHDSFFRSQLLVGLGICQRARFDQTSNADDFHAAALNFGLASTSVHGLPNDRFDASSNLARLSHRANDFMSALPAYRRAITILPLVAWIGLNADSQLGQLTQDSQDLVCDAASCAIELAEQNQHCKQQYLGDALELLDQGRSVMWSHASNVRADLEDLQMHDSALAEELDYNAQILIRAGFTHSGPTPPTEQDEQAYRRAAEKHTQLVEKIRNIPGFDRFLLPPSITELQRAAINGDIVVINVSQFRCDALIIRSGQELELVPFSGVTIGDVERLVESLSTEVTAFEDGGCSSLSDSLHETWSLFGNSIVKHLLSDSKMTLPRVWWYMTGPLTFIPIHACFPKPSRNRRREAPGMMDLVISSYTSTISALLRAQKLQISPPFRMLAIAQPEAIGEAGPLLSAMSEVESLQSVIGPRESTTLVGQKATVDEVASALERCTWAHFACHAFQDLNQPTKSAFLMHDGHLTLSHLAQSPLRKAQFAYLSACQSAKGSKFLPNESVHIAAGLQLVGFRSVVGTMWSIDDEDGAFVAKQFYEHLFKDNNSYPHASDTAHALHLAVQQLRRNRAPLSQWVPFIHIGI